MHTCRPKRRGTDKRNTYKSAGQLKEELMHASRPNRKGTHKHTNTPKIRKMHTHLQVKDNKDTYTQAGQ
jgi:hypothetical protein